MRPGLTKLQLSNGLLFSKPSIRVRQFLPSLNRSRQLLDIRAMSSETNPAGIVEDASKSHSKTDPDAASTRVDGNGVCAGYQLPPKSIRDLVQVPSQPVLSISPNRNKVSTHFDRFKKTYLPFVFKYC